MGVVEGKPWKKKKQLNYYMCHKLSSKEITIALVLWLVEHSRERWLAERWKNYCIKRLIVSGSLFLMCQTCGFCFWLVLSVNLM